MFTKSDGLALLRNALNNQMASFRDGQWEAIDSLVNHQNRVQVVQRTGWGKSSLFLIKNIKIKRYYSA